MWLPSTTEVDQSIRPAAFSRRSNSRWRRCQTPSACQSPKARRTAIQQLADRPTGAPRIVLATGRYIGEGFDDPRLDTLLLAMPIAWKGTVVQYAGRLHRTHPGKHDATVYDYVDAELPVLRRMFAKRLKAYRTLGYELATST